MVVLGATVPPGVVVVVVVVVELEATVVDVLEVGDDAPDVTTKLAPETTRTAAMVAAPRRARIMPVMVASWG